MKNDTTFVGMRSGDHLVTAIACIFYFKNRWKILKSYKRLFKRVEGEEKKVKKKKKHLGDAKMSKKGTSLRRI